MEYFQKPRIAVIGTSQWQLVFSELFEERRCILLKQLIWVKGGGGGGGGGGYGYTQKRLCVILKWVFLDNFS